MAAGYNFIDTARRFRRFAGVDRAVAFTVLGRAWSSVAGLISLVAVGQFLTPDEQGYYYTFASLLALQVFAELGLTNVILQFASHEAAHLGITSRGIAHGSARARSRLASVLWFSLRWYGAAAAVFVLGLVFVGWTFFAKFSNADAGVSWQIPWIATVLAAAGMLLVTPITALLEGCGLVTEVARYRLLQAVGANGALWVALGLGAGLASAAVFAVVNLLITVAWLAGRYRGLVKELLSINGGDAIDWRREIWPYQWRIAISWLCGYFVFQMFTPLVFAFVGPVPAGQMGMSLTIAAAVSAVGLSWLSTKAPRFGALVAKRQFVELDSLFFRSAAQALCASACCACGVIMLALIVNAAGHPIANRILAPGPLVCLVLANVINLVVVAEAIYLRAFKREPFLVLSMLSASLNTLTATVFALAGSTANIAVGYLAITLFVGLGLGTWIFRTSRRHWQHELRAERSPLRTMLPLTAEHAIWNTPQPAGSPAEP